MKKSRELREEGNALYAAGKYGVALIKFSSALVFAPLDQVDYSLALANRSACLYMLGYYQRSLEDTILAENTGYPREKIYKLMVGKCLKYLSRRRIRIADFYIFCPRNGVHSVYYGLDGDQKQWN